MSCNKVRVYLNIVRNCTNLSASNENCLECLPFPKPTQTNRDHAPFYANCVQRSGRSLAALAKRPTALVRQWQHDVIYQLFH